MKTAKMELMANVAEQIERLPEALQYKAQGYVDALTDIAAAAKRAFLKEFDRAAASKSISDDDFRASLEAEFGTLDL